MSGESEITIGEADDEAFVIIKLAGRCCAMTCPTVRDFVQARIPPQAKDAYFDLSAATSIDSTFTGLLVASARTGSERMRARPHLVSPAPRILQALESMHVTHMFDVVKRAPEGVRRWRRLHRVCAPAEDVADLVIQAHETLMGADDRNKSVFSPVVRMFRAERQSRRSDAD